MAPVLYATLANAGYFPKEELLTLRKYNSRLQGHPGRDMGLPGIETSSGSLGQGISIAVGMAMSDKLVDKSDRRVFSLTGDGELQEGSVWEAAMAASHYKLDNFCWIIDNNDCQIDGRINEVMNVYPIDAKCESFGFDTITVDGHNYEELYAAFDRFIENHRNGTGRPTAIVAKTYMGKAGLIEPPGLAAIEAARNDGSWTRIDLAGDLVVPEDLRRAFEAYPGAGDKFDAFPPSTRRAILEWITQARTAETRDRRVQEAARQAQQNIRANQPRQPKAAHHRD